MQLLMCDVLSLGCTVDNNTFDPLCCGWVAGFSTLLENEPGAAEVAIPSR